MFAICREWTGPVISASTVRKVRAQCLEYQREFAERFGVSKRTVIRWEQNGAQYRWWDQPKGKPWRALAKKHAKLFTKAELEAIRE